MTGRQVVLFHFIRFFFSFCLVYDLIWVLRFFSKKEKKLSLAFAQFYFGLRHTEDGRTHGSGIKKKKQSKVMLCLQNREF